MRDPEAIVTSLKNLFINYIGKGVLKNNALVQLDIQEFVYEICDEDVPIWINIGTSQNPIWLVSRGTNQWENYHLLNKNLKLYRYDYEIGNAIYVNSLFVYSHRSRCYRKNLDILEYFLDPTLAMRLKILMHERSDFIKFPLILTGYQNLVEIPEKDYVCGFISV